LARTARSAAGLVDGRTAPASLEANEEKPDTIAQQTEGTDQVQMQGYQDRKYREVVGTKYARELILK
jgi:hypothetical protein